jgi:hypothetical protein
LRNAECVRRQKRARELQSMLQHKHTSYLDGKREDTRAGAAVFKNLD